MISKAILKKVLLEKFLLLFLLIIIMVNIFGCVKEEYRIIRIEINGKMYVFEKASTEEERRKGLMFRKKLNKDSGMFFIYEDEDYRGFYMKNTFIPLDIAFINSEFWIIDIQSMKPLDETIIVSKGKAKYVLEVNKGFFKRAGLKIGDKVKIKR